MAPNVGATITESINQAFIAAARFVPNLIAGIIILLIGIILGAIVKKLLHDLLDRLNLEGWLKKYGVPEVRAEFSWSNILSEIGRWFVIIIFLIPAVDVWGLREFTNVLNKFLIYLPNVFIAAIIALVGYVFARLSHDVVLASTRGISKEVSQTIATVTKWAIIIFVTLAVLTQLGVAQNLIQILFTGFVAMLAIAGGIAFGLGGQETAKQILEAIKKNITQTKK